MSSRLGEDAVIKRLLDEYPSNFDYCVDIGASYGEAWSNVWECLKSGWSSLLVECDPEKYPTLKTAAYQFPKASVETEKCTPINVCKMLASHGVPMHFDLLSLDIDGYDYHVLRALLRTHRPEIIVCEINTCVPPPYKFSVNFDPKYWWGSNPFFGMSLAAVHELLSSKGYKMIDLIEDNAIFSLHGEGKDINEAWMSGCIKYGEFGWGKQQAVHISTLSEADAIDYIYNGMWGGCIGKFEVWL